MLRVAHREGQLAVVEASGQLTRKDTDQLFSELKRLLRERGRLRVLLRLRDFEGWEIPALQRDLEFSIEHRGDLEKLAVLDHAWPRPVSAKLAQPLYAERVRFFAPEQEDAALAWLRTR